MNKSPEDFQFKTKPFAHQFEAFQLIRDRPFYALLMEMGTGKSKVLIDNMAWLFLRGEINAALIVAPKSVVRVWSEDQLPTHMSSDIGRRLIVAWNGGHTTKEQELLRELFNPDPLCLKILVMNVEALSLGTPRKPGRAMVLARSFLESHRALMAVDESTTIKSPKAQRTDNVINLGQRAAYRRILTGTPVTQSPLDIFCQYDFLANDLLQCGNYYAFRNRYAVLQRKVINGRSFDQVVGYQRLDELQGLVAKYGYRKLKAECLDLPPKLYETRYVALGKEQERIYRQLRDEAVAELDASQFVSAPLFLTRLLRLRQILAGYVRTEEGNHKFEDNPRMETLLETLEEITGKVIIWVSFIDPLLEVTRRLNERYGEGSAVPFYGEIPAKTRQDFIEYFQAPGDRPRFFIGQVRTGGLGLTLTAANTVIYYDHDWSLEARQQSEDRAHRIGQNRNVTYIDLVAPDTVDEAILAALRTKRELADVVTGDGWRKVIKEGKLPI